MAPKIAPGPVSTSYFARYADVFITLVVNLSLLSAGIALTWSSSAISKFTKADSDQNPIGRRITTNEQAWIGSSVLIGAIFGTLIVGFIAKHMGRRIAIAVGCLFFMIGFIVLATTKSVAQVICGRVIQGLGVGFVMTTVAIYVGEISGPGRRGPLGSLILLFFSLGFLFYSLLDLTDHYIITQCVCVMIPVIAGIAVMFVPETPHFLIWKKRKDDAIKSLMVLRNATSAQVMGEIKSIEETVIVEEKKIIGRFTDLFMVRGIRRAMFISLGLIFFQQFSGVLAILCHLKHILEVSEVSDINVAVVIMALFMTICCLLTPWIAVVYGRRSMLLLSSFGMFCMLVLFAIYTNWIETNSKYLDGSRWLPVTTLCLYLGFYCIGLGPIPWVVVGEMFPPYVKPMAASLVSAICWIFGFVVVHNYPSIEADFGTSICLYIFGLTCLCALFFTMISVMETKGLTLWQIQTALNSNTRVN